MIYYTLCISVLFTFCSVSSIQHFLETVELKSMSLFGLAFARSDLFLVRRNWNCASIQKLYLISLSEMDSLNISTASATGLLPKTLKFVSNTNDWQGFNQFILFFKTSGTFMEFKLFNGCTFFLIGCHFSDSCAIWVVECL